MRLKFTSIFFAFVLALYVFSVGQLTLKTEKPEVFSNQ